MQSFCSGESGGGKGGEHSVAVGGQLVALRMGNLSERQLPGASGRCGSGSEDFGGDDETDSTTAGQPKHNADTMTPPKPGDA